MRRLVLCTLIVLGFSAAGAQSPIVDLTPDDLANGKRLFEGQCARCHGIGGTGGEGPPLTRPRLRHAPDDEVLFAVIKDGLAGTGMPQTWQMNDGEIWQVAGYVRSLGRTAPVSLPGNRDRGRALYEMTGCATCHIVSGQGENTGPELTEIGALRGSEYLREALTDPSAVLPKGTIPSYPIGYAEYLPVLVVTRAGQEVRGMRVNEDTFTIQIRDGDNRFRSFRKQELMTLERQPERSLMPSYNDQLSATQLDDLVAYLSSLRGEP